MNEIKTIEVMIRLYCKKKHGADMCQDCTEVYNYALQRIEKCPQKEVKTFCSSCKIHCYKPQMREKIREIMKFSGPRMLIYSPKLAILHVCDTIKGKVIK